MFLKLYFWPLFFIPSSFIIYIPSGICFFSSLASLADGEFSKFLITLLISGGTGFGAYILGPKITNYFVEKNKKDQNELLLNDKYLNELLSSLKL
jgi:hypothetical protein